MFRKLVYSDTEELFDLALEEMNHVETEVLPRKDE